MARRIVLFLLTNLLVIVTLSVVVNLVAGVFGLGGYLQEGGGIDLGALFVFALLWGMGGAFISLQISRWMAKRFMRVRVIDPEKANGSERALLELVHRLARQAGLEKMPEVGFYDAQEVNAFATGPSRRRSLVAVSSGLLRQLDGNAVEGVLAHEVAHIANGDMVTMTLLQGVMNAFAIFLSRVLAGIVCSFLDDEEGGVGFLVYFAFSIVFEILLVLLGSLVVAAYSRHREFSADAGGAALAGRTKMVSALQQLRQSLGTAHAPAAEGKLATMKISGRPGGLLSLFASHPPLEKRIQRLQQN